jgi:hypothetical protein
MNVQAESKTIPTWFWLLIGALCSCSLYVRLTLNFNTPYIDECDYIFVGRALLSGEPWLTKTYMFSSDVHLYLYGWTDRIMQLVGWGEQSYIAARAVAMILGGLSLWFFYRFVLVVFKRNDIALVATVFLAVFAPHAFIAKFATYDIVCCVLFIGALWLLAEGVIGERSSWWFVIAGGVIFSLAVLAKYIAIAYAPFLAVAIFAKNRRASMIFAAVGAAIVGGYVWVYRVELLELYRNQIMGTHSANATRWEILGIAGWYAGLLALLALGNTVLRGNRSLQPGAYAVLWIFAVPLVVYHVRSSDMISLYKHMVYAGIFLAPIAAEFVVRLLHTQVSSRFLQLCIAQISPTLICIALGIALCIQVSQIETAYPNTQAVTTFVRNNSTSETTILSEDTYLFRYAFFPRIPARNLEEITWYDNDADGKRTEQDVIDGVWDGKFEYVYLNDLISPILGAELKRGVLPNRYQKIMEIPYHNSSVMNPRTNGTLTLYRLRR